jgi:hypothetical protein
MGINSFFRQRVVHTGKKSFSETVLKPGFGQFMSPVLQPRELRKNGSVYLLEAMKDAIEESTKKRNIRGNAISFYFHLECIRKRDEQFRSCVESLVCCKLMTDRNGVISFDDPLGNLPVSVSGLTSFDPIMISPKRLRDYLSLNVPKGYEEEFHGLIRDFRQRRKSFLDFNFGNEINIYVCNPNNKKTPKKGICSCEICAKRTKNTSHVPIEHLITSHHIIPTRYGGENDEKFIANLCMQCHNHGMGLESVISFFEDNARKMRLGQKISLLEYNPRDTRPSIAAVLARNSYPKVYPMDYLNLFSNAVALAIVCTYFQEDTVVKINELRDKRLANSILPFMMDLWH